MDNQDTRKNQRSFGSHLVVSLVFSLSLWGTSLMVAHGEDNGVSQPQAEAASLLDAHIANLESLKSFDLFIEMSNFASGPPGNTIEIISKERWIHSEESKFDLFVRFAEREEILVEEGNKPRKALSYSFAMQNKGRIFQRNFPDRLTSASLDGVNFHEIVCTPVVPMVGLQQFPTPGSIPDNLRKGILTDLRTPQVRHSLLQNADGNVTVLFQDSESSPQPWHFRRRYDVDVKNLVVTSLRLGYREKGAAEWKPTVVEQIEWRKVGGIRVPSKCAGEAVQTRQDKKGGYYDETSLYDAKFTWVSVNEVIETESHDLSKLMTIEELSQYVEVKKLKDITEPL